MDAGAYLRASFRPAEPRRPSWSALLIFRGSSVTPGQFLTFPNTEQTPGLLSIALLPRDAPDTAGRWRVWLWLDGDGEEGRLVWDRKTEGVRVANPPWWAPDARIGLWRDEGAQTANPRCSAAQQVAWAFRPVIGGVNMLNGTSFADPPILTDGDQSSAEDFDLPIRRRIHRRTPAPRIDALRRDLHRTFA
jgi:hypothetical protein